MQNATNLGFILGLTNIMLVISNQAEMTQKISVVIVATMKSHSPPTNLKFLCMSNIYYSAKFIYGCKLTALFISVCPLMRKILQISSCIY